MKTRASFIFIVVSLICVELLPKIEAVSPPPDGGYPGGNTAEGQDALLSRTTGVWNTALGYQALYQDTTGYSNTASGLRALFSNINGYGNVATGVYALFSNTTGASNTADGYRALAINTIGSFNTASGNFALFSNTIGGNNAAYGDSALVNNTVGAANTAMGEDALEANTTGDWNTAVGGGALGGNSIGSFNIALGAQAGLSVTTADNVICIGYGVGGENSSNRRYIGNIYGVTPGAATAVYVNSLGQLGTIVSSLRFKDEIKPMDKASEAILALKPVTFRYKREIDPARNPQFGLVAEDVEKVNPNLVVRDADGEVNTVRYDAVNAMLLNEFLKEHHKVEQLEATVVNLAATVKEQAVQLQKVSREIAIDKPGANVFSANP